MNMRWLICFSASALLILSCGLDQIGESLRTDTEGVWKSPSFGKFSSGICYVSAFEYPEGQNWKGGEDKNGVSLVMYADGSPVLRMKVGSQWNISSDPDRHRIVDGHLYTDFTDGNTTMVKKDGVLLHEWAGAEEVVALVECDGSVHCLTRPVSGEGFVYRMDGRSVVERSAGTPFSYFAKGDEGLVFYFSQMAMTSDGSKLRYYQVADGKVTRLEACDQADYVWDIRLHEGQLKFLATVGNHIQLMGTDKVKVIYGPDPEDLISCTFVESDELAAVMKSVDDSGDILSRLFWFQGDLMVNYITIHPISAVQVCPDGYDVLINPADGVSGHLVGIKRKIMLPEGYAAVSRTCMCRKDSLLYLGLSSSDNGYPLIWNEGKVDTLRINGYISGLQ